MKDELVLCIDRKHLTERLEDLPHEAWQLLNRKIVDDTKDTFMGRQFLQIIPVLVLKHKDTYLSYTRKGSESRLHGKRSISVGGHVSFEDCVNSSSFLESVLNALSREAKEEAGIDIEIPLELLSDVFYVPEDPVSSVHAGVYAILEAVDVSEEALKDLVNGMEINDPKWLTLDEMLQAGEWEIWAEHIIADIKKQEESEQEASHSETNHEGENQGE